MNNTINNVSSVSFNARYLNMQHMEKLPPRISEAIYKSKAVGEFLEAGKPKTFWGKIIDFFRRDEILEVYHTVEKESELNTSLPSKILETEKSYCDPFEQKEFLEFWLLKGKNIEKVRILSASQEGVLRPAGSVPKQGEHPLFKSPIETAEDKLVKLTEKMQVLFK